jgi:ABC-2 type transport system ATP-binding protein
MKDDVAIKVSHISKSFRLPHEKHNSLKDKAVHIFGPRNFTKFKALEDIDFEVKKGEFFGIVGKNGSGKSTLLKILANIYQPTSGKVEVNGSLAPFIELGVGFNPELTGRENVFLSGTILGLTKKKIESIYDDIVSFAEIEEFMDQKLKNYSSGMQVRLAFSIAVRAESDILLIDEVLAVGDSAFQTKCLNYFEELKRIKKTVVFVSHDMDAVTQFCDKAILINEGNIRTQGSSEMVANNYYKLNIQTKNNNTADEHIGRILEEAWLTDKNNKRTNTFSSPKEINIHTKWKNNLAVENIGLAIFRNDGVYCFGTNTILDKHVITKNRVSLNLTGINLARGTYIVKVGLFGKTDRSPVEFVEDAVTFIIEDSAAQHGFIRLKSNWK